MQKAVYEFISRQTNDPIIERKKCRRTGQDFPVFQWDKDLLEKLKITIGDKTYIPTISDICPEARTQYKLMFKNERRLYKTTCALTWKSTISCISPETGLTIYDKEARASDARDYCDYGIEIDSKKSVFDHMAQLVKSTPYQDLIWSFSNLKHNSVYTNYTSDMVDCYFAFDCNTLEKCCHVSRCRGSKQLFDCLRVNGSEACYQCVDCENMYKSFFCNSCTSCHNSYYLSNCHGCYDCIGCTNLVNKQYYIFNKQVSKSDYQAKLAELQKDYSNPEIVKTFAEILRISPRKNLHIINSEGVIGNHIINAKNIFFSNLIGECDTMRYCDEMKQAQDCFDVCGYGNESYLLYNCTQAGRYSNHIYCSASIGKWENILYCMETKKSSNCFGCVNLKEKEYCIFNTPYTKEEYEKLVPELIANMQKEKVWLNFLPTEFSPYPYNDSVANDYYPIHTLIINGQTQIINPNWRWTVTVLQPEKFLSDAILDLGWEKIKTTRRTRENEVNTPEWITIVEANHIGELPSDEEILKVAITCEVSGRPFRIVPPELEFYRKHWLPLPRKHPDIRHAERLAQRPGKELFLRKCDKCGVEMLSVYAENSWSQVYCEQCYNKEIYW